MEFVPLEGASTTVGLEPREQMTRWAGRLIAINIAAFILTLNNIPLLRALAFVPALTLQRPWTLVTYMFLHAGIGHLFFNMLGLFFFGPRVEARIGSRNFLLLYFARGLSGSVFSLILVPTSPVIGSSRSFFCIFLTFARFSHHQMNNLT